MPLLGFTERGPRGGGTDPAMLDLRDMLHLHLPLATQAFERSPARSPDEAQGDDGEQAAADEQSTVLIVDDDASVRHVISSVLREEGYAVRAAASAEQALELLRATGEVPTVLSDLKMPGHDGIWLLDEILQRHPHAAVVMLTAAPAAANVVVEVVPVWDDPPVLPEEELGGGSTPE